MSGPIDPTPGQRWFREKLAEAVECSRRMPVGVSGPWNLRECKSAAEREDQAVILSFIIWFAACAGSRKVMYLPDHFAAALGLSKAVVKRALHAALGLGVLTNYTRPNEIRGPKTPCPVKGADEKRILFTRLRALGVLEPGA